MRFDREKVLVGITPTCWVNDDNPLLSNETSFEQILSEIALAEFDGCSIGHKFPTDADALRAALDLRGLRISEPWVSTYFTARDMDRRTEENFVRQMTFVK